MNNDCTLQDKLSDQPQAKSSDTDSATNTNDETLIGEELDRQKLFAELMSVFAGGDGPYSNDGWEHS